MKKVFSITWIIAIVLMLILLIDTYNDYIATTQPVTNCPALKETTLEAEWIRSERMLEFCMLELAKKLQTPEKMEEWFKDQGYPNVLLVSNTINTIRINVNWDFNSSIESKGFPFKKLKSFLSYMFDIQVVYKNSVPTEVNSWNRIL